ncbi:replication/maintenance protein RepL [Pectinatus sottacetonis]|uniref:replication/maintenance protein RepL n=1 Tax=Pectinatus sottacetonis TaxID=1002795 RepID=UPI0018C841C3|nr:replication/maintenance protein RepL [Pectinatus sottacetonis]
MARRTNVTKYKENPFLKETTLQSIQGNRTITGTGEQSDTRLVVTSDTEEIKEMTGFYTKVEVDKTHFLKIYSLGIRTLTGLSSAGMKTFSIIYNIIILNKQYTKDTILLNYDMLEDEQQATCSRATFYRGLKDLLKKNFIAETLISGVYFINPTYIYNGNRLALVNEYILKENNTELEKRSKNK